MLADTLGGGEGESSDEESDIEEDEQAPPAVPATKVATAIPNKSAVAEPKVKLSKKERINKTAEKKATIITTATEEQSPEQSTVQTIQDVEAFARGHAIWTQAKTKKEFNKALFPYFKEKLGFGQNKALQALAKLRWTWEKEQQERLEEEMEARREKQVKNVKAPIATKAKKVKESATTAVGKKVDDGDVNMEDASASTRSMAESGAATETDVSTRRSKQKRKRDGNSKDDSSVQALPNTDPNATASVADDEEQNITLSKGQAKKAAKRQKRAGDKLNLVNSKDWYNNDKTEAPIVDVPEVLTADADGLAAPVQTQPKKKKVKRSPTESSHFSKSGSSSAPDKTASKAARDELIASLANDLLQDKPQLANGAAAVEEADDAEREPTYFSSGVVTMNVDQATAASARAPKNNQAKQPALTKKERKALAAERNRERQLAQNQAANDPNIERTVIETKKAEQSASFSDMAKKAREAVKAAAAIVEKTVRENEKAQNKKEKTSKLSSAVESTADESKSKRKRKRNNNRLSDADGQAVPETVTEEAQPVSEAKQPLETAIVNEQTPSEAGLKRKRNRKSKQQLQAERSKEESKDNHS